MRLRKYVIFRETEDGGVILDQQTGIYWQLNPSGALTIDRLTKGRSEIDIASELASLYDVEADQVRKDVSNLVAELRLAKLASER